MHALVDVLGVDDDSALVGMAMGLLEVVIANNVFLLRRHPGRFPMLYQSGVRFRAEPWATPAPLSRVPPIEQFCPIPTIIARAWGDCAQLCAWRVAELREIGDETTGNRPDPDAGLHIYLRTQGHPKDPRRRRWFHVEVRRGYDGEIEDPSRRLEF